MSHTANVLHDFQLRTQVSKGCCLPPIIIRKKMVLLGWCGCGENTKGWGRDSNVKVHSILYSTAHKSLYLIFCAQKIVHVIGIIVILHREL